MKRLLFVGALLVLAMTGCRKSEGPLDEPLTDEQAIQSAVISADSIADFSEAERYALDDDGAKPWDYNEGSWPKVGDAQDPITPLRWGRRVTSVNRSVTVVFLDDSAAIATITKVFAGNLIILAVKDTGGGPDTVLITKAFTDTVRRKILFARVGRGENRLHNWRPVAISLVEGHSPTNDFEITELQITTPRDTITVTDPLETWIVFWRIHNGIPRVRPVEPVGIRVTVTSQNDSAEFVVLRWGVGWDRLSNGWDGRRHRVRIRLVSDNVIGGVHIREYQGTFPCHRHFGRFNAFIDAISYKTLYDDTAPYSNRFWGLPYIATSF